MRNNGFLSTLKVDTRAMHSYGLVDLPSLNLQCEAFLSFAVSFNRSVGDQLPRRPQHFPLFTKNTNPNLLSDMAQVHLLFSRFFISVIATAGIIFSLTCFFINADFIYGKFDQLVLVPVFQQYLLQHFMTGGIEVFADNSDTDTLTPSISSIAVFILLGFVGTGSLFSSTFLFVGIFRKNPRYFLPWIISTSSLLVFLAITIFAICFAGGSSYTAISAVAVAEAVFIICIGCIGVVLDYKTQIELEYSKEKFFKI